MRTAVKRAASTQSRGEPRGEQRNSMEPWSNCFWSSPGSGLPASWSKRNFLPNGEMFPLPSLIRTTPTGRTTAQVCDELHVSGAKDKRSLSRLPEGREKCKTGCAPEPSSALKRPPVRTTHSTCKTGPDHPQPHFSQTGMRMGRISLPVLLQAEQLQPACGRDCPRDQGVSLEMRGSHSACVCASFVHTPEDTSYPYRILICF
ncbi:uncharacterized protein [Eschrichtius robustus]|uniref:uncharacterized protein n=1 Tax=Eschrichtius robustus TaxID=9764 RepID=UPI0035BF6C97